MAGVGPDVPGAGDTRPVPFSRFSQLIDFISSTLTAAGCFAEYLRLWHL